MASRVRAESVSDYAQRCGLSEQHVYHLIHSGELQAIKHRPFGKGAWHWVIETTVTDQEIKLMKAEDGNESNT